MGKSSPTLKPGETIGIIGGGQLGRMLAMAAARLGFQTVTLDPDANAPAEQVSNRHITAAFDDHGGLSELMKSSAVITYEFENIGADALLFLEENTHLIPNVKALEISQDRLVEKRFLNGLDIPTSRFYEVNNLQDLRTAVDTEKTGSILKTRRFGYDGKGQVRLNANPNEATLKAAWEAVAEAPCILEGFITFQREISVIIARNAAGQTKAYDPAENIHREGILRTSTVPAAIDQQTAARAVTLAEKIVHALDYVGVMGVELFVGDDGTLIANEIAPRVHNSGHWTEAACANSQFEQHIRAVAGLPLADTARHSNCVMENLIGDDMDQLPELLADSGILLHLYGKAETRPGRKMGHFTRLTDRPGA